MPIRSRLPVRAAGLALAAAACADAVPVLPSPLAESTTPVAGVPGLVQVVRVLPGSPVTGDTIAITSVLRNTGRDSTPTVAVSICGPGVRGSLAMRNPFVSCAGWAMSTSIAPGDSATDATLRVVASGPGTYRLEVQQLRTDSAWAGIDVVVR